MLTRLATLVHSKIALAVLGVVLAGGAGTAVATVANGGQLPLTHPATQANAAASSAHHDNASDHAHTISIEGTLKAYDAGAKTISVLPNNASSATTVAVNSDTRVNGEHASSLSDLTHAVGHAVQVQATKQKDGTLLAWKITVEGADTDHGSSSGTGTGQNNGSGAPGANGQVQTLHGTVVSVGVGSFVLKLDGGTQETINVSSSTHFDGAAHSLAGLKSGMQTTVRGAKQSSGAFAATQVSSGGE